MKAGASTVFNQSLAGLEVFAADRSIVPFGELLHHRQIDSEVGCAVRKGNSFLKSGIGINHRGRDILVIFFETFFEGCDRLMHGSRGKEDLCRSAPDHYLAIGDFLIGLDVGAKLLRQIALVLSLLHVGAAQPLDIVLIEDRGHGPDAFEEGPNLPQLLVLEHPRRARRLEHVVFENIPAGKTKIVELCQGNEVFHKGVRASVRLPSRMVPI